MNKTHPVYICIFLQKYSFDLEKNDWVLCIQVSSEYVWGRTGCLDGLI